MKKITYHFNEAIWGMVGVGFDYNATPEIEDEISQLRQLYPEIAAWGDLSLFTAWGSYSQDHFSLNWQPVAQRDELFLAYLYHVEHNSGQWRWTDADAQLAVEKMYA
ncbi:hypothetical protein [Kaarinaea lacus]